MSGAAVPGAVPAKDGTPRTTPSRAPVHGPPRGGVRQWISSLLLLPGQAVQVRLQAGVGHRMKRRWDGQCASSAYDQAREALQLETPAPRQVMVHGRVHVRRKTLVVPELLLGDVVGQRDATCSCD